MPHLNGAGQLAGEGHARHHAVGGWGEDAAQDNAFAERVRNDGRHDDQDGRKEVRGAIEVAQGTNLACQRHLAPGQEGRGDLKFVLLGGGFLYLFFFTNKGTLDLSFEC